MTVTLEVPDELAASIPANAAGVADLISAGLRSRHERREHRLRDVDNLMEVLASLPAPEEVLALQPPPSLLERTGFLLAASRDRPLTGEERQDLDDILRLEHLVRIAKSRAHFMLNAAVGAA